MSHKRLETETLGNSIGIGANFTMLGKPLCLLVNVVCGSGHQQEEAIRYYGGKGEKEMEN